MTRGSCSSLGAWCGLFLLVRIWDVGFGVGGSRGHGMPSERRQRWRAFSGRDDDGTARTGEAEVRSARTGSKMRVRETGEAGKQYTAHVR
ncbi:hypothetical protein C8Q73DRAFT_362932 [Cubamyces lactineus]|nr:hypothetical protein C8Q73DRAFT_362932 [Cubamyces lactineus]